MISQLTLFFLAAMFYLFLTLLGWLHIQMLRCCKDIPPTSKGLITFNLIFPLGYSGLQLTVVLMLLIWDLNYLALATGIIWVILVIINIQAAKPWLKHRKAIH